MTLCCWDNEVFPFSPEDYDIVSPATVQMCAWKRRNRFVRVAQYSATFHGVLRQFGLYTYEITTYDDDNANILSGRIHGGPVDNVCISG